MAYVSFPRLNFEHWNDWRLRAAVLGADLALRLHVRPGWLLDRLLENLGEAFQRTEEDPETLAHLRWFGSHLRAFLERLLLERPAAARAVPRLLATEIRDVYRRTAAQRAGLPTPSTVVIEPTDRCNLRCPGCYAASQAGGHDLAYETLVEIVRQAIAMGVTLVTLSGGEPFLRERSERVITRLAERFPDHGFLVYTNGTLIDEATAERLGALGNVFPAISVEGFEAETDARRGSGVYQRNRQVRQLLASQGVMSGFSVTVTRRNAELVTADRFIEQRLEEGDLFGWFFLYQPIGRSPDPNLTPTAQQRAMLREAVTRWRRQNRPIFLGDFWNDGPLVGGCIAGGRYYFHIRANGDISPCVFAPITCGNVLEILAGRTPYRDLCDFVARNPVFAAFREHQARIRDRARPCLLMDHPWAVRQIAAVEGCRPASNMPNGYLDGPIAQAMDALAAEWAAVSQNSNRSAS